MLLFFSNTYLLKKHLAKTCLYLSYGIIILNLTACGPAAPAADHEGEDQPTTTTSANKIVSLSGTITELFFKLGMQDKLVGVDITSTYPEAARELPQLGHISQLNAESILALEPDLIVHESSSTGPSEVLTQLASSGIEVVEIETSHRLENPLEVLDQLNEHFEIPTGKRDILAQTIAANQASLTEYLSLIDGNPRVLFLYARGMGRLMVGGSATSAAQVIELAGGINAIQSFEDFEALTPEALVEASPDIILMFSSGLASLDGKEGLAQIPGMSATPAFQNDRIIAMDGLLLTGFGPRSSDAILELAKRFHSSALSQIAN
ncbi:MAG: ABC transporter substrate-binding protein [Bacteroidota bacterium]